MTDLMGGGATSSVVSDAANILGTDRTVSIEQLGPGATPADININTGTPGLLTLGNTDALSISNISYEGIGGGGLGGIDVTEGGSDDRFSLFQVTGDFPTNITITVRDTLANVGSLMLASAPLGMNVPLLFEYTSFSGAVDFTMIDFINIELATTNDQADLRLDFFGTTTEVAEPGVLAVLGLGLAGLGLARRRRR